MARQYIERLGKRGVAYFGEKTPEHTGHLPRIREMFPNAKILVLYRDGRDVAASLSRMPWMTSDLYVNFLVWLYYHQVLEQARTVDSSNLFCVRYEDIVADPQGSFARILNFLELPYEAAVAEGCGNKEGIPEREYGWKSRALQKISTDRVATFQRDIDEGQLAILERLGRDVLPALGYQLTTDGNAPLSPGFLLRLSYNLLKFVYRLPWASLLNEFIVRSFSSFSSPAEHPLAPAFRPISA
jgi:hypothetical protein